MITKKTIVAHCLVCNEERFIWYAIKSVIDHVDQIIVWDTGSEDNTLAIIESIKSPKIVLLRKPKVDQNGHTKYREQMLAQSIKDGYDWLLILDGDEIWPKKSIQLAVDSITNDSKMVAMGVTTVNFLGDIYHRSPQSSGHYRLGNKIGHLNLRFINLKAKDLHVKGPHGQQGYYHGEILLQDLKSPQLQVRDDIYYFHATHLVRSSYDRSTLKRSFKRKYLLGEKIDPTDLPSIFFEAPDNLVDVTKPVSLSYKIIAKLISLPHMVYRKILPPTSGY